MKENEHTGGQIAPDLSVVEPLAALRQIVAMLRAPGGCPWDREQTHRSLRSDLIEEAYEVVEAIDAADDANLREELGDLLLQVVFHARIAEEESRFTFDHVARAIAEKLVRRHPHVFAGAHCGDTTAVLQRWDEIKRAEKGSDAQSGTLGGVPIGLPALLRAQKVQKAAARVGFDWSEVEPVLGKVREEIAEVETALCLEENASERGAQLQDEIGDLLFAAVNLARKTNVDAELALQQATQKFAARFEAMERLAKERGATLKGMTLGEMDALWEEVKAASRR